MENIDPFINLLMIFVLACIIGYYVIWGVTSALHSPLMAVTNAISSVIIVGALIAAGPEEINFSSLMGFFAIILASINIFGGFVVSHRMLSMFKKKDKKKEKKMSENFTAISYLISAIFFILALKGLSHPESARNGNVMGIIGMIIAIVTTAFNP